MGTVGVPDRNRPCSPRPGTGNRGERTGAACLGRGAQAAFDAKPATINLADFSVHDVAAVLKRFIRELPQPIFTARLQSIFFATLGTARPWPSWTTARMAHTLPSWLRRVSSCPLSLGRIGRRGGRHPAAGVPATAPHNSAHGQPRSAAGGLFLFEKSAGPAVRRQPRTRAKTSLQEGSPARDDACAAVVAPAQVARHASIEDGNKMTSRNLAVVFAPNMARNLTQLEKVCVRR